MRYAWPHATMNDVTD